MQTTYRVETQPAAVDGGAERVTYLRKRIGSTTYVVAVHFSRTSGETMQDKILRLIDSEVQHYA